MLTDLHLVGGFFGLTIWYLIFDVNLCFWLVFDSSTKDILHHFLLSIIQNWTIPGFILLEKTLSPSSSVAISFLIIICIFLLTIIICKPWVAFSKVDSSAKGHKIAYKQLVMSFGYLQVRRKLDWR